jgi:DNA-binding response OmpR family regulator
MAGEPILIVDDTPVNLKLTRILLANEGYRVQTAASAEEALELLRTYHPRLILADIQLPGMDGLEMTRRLKQDEHTKDIMVVALTAFAMKDDERKARDAGCDGYITKPIDTRTLGARIREYLGQTGQGSAEASEPAASPSKPDGISGADLHSLRRRFLAEGEAAVRALLADLDGAFRAAEAGRVVHQWVGAGALLGYHAIARISSELNTLLAERPIDAAEVRQALTNLALAFTSQCEALDLPVPQLLMDLLSAKHVAIIGLPLHDGYRLAAALERASAKPLVWDAAASPAERKLEDYDVAVISVPPGTVAAVPTPAHPPSVFVGRGEDLLNRNRPVLPVGSRILLDSWQPEEALLRIGLAIFPRGLRAATGRPIRTVTPGTKPQALLVADDPTLLALIRMALENSGVDHQTASNDAEVLKALRRVQPDTVVVDADLRAADLQQVLSTVRSDELAPPVLLLAGRPKTSDVLSAAAIGIDDFLLKPFSPVELVARLKRTVL